MGCEACQSHVRTLIERHPGVALAESVDFTTGGARLLVSDAWGFDRARLFAALAEDGYERRRRWWKRFGRKQKTRSRRQHRPMDMTWRCAIMLPLRKPKRC